jgi:hypothetical protein
MLSTSPDGRGLGGVTAKPLKFDDTGSVDTEKHPGFGRGAHLGGEVTCRAGRQLPWALPFSKMYSFRFLMNQIGRATLCSHFRWDLPLLFPYTSRQHHLFRGGKGVVERLAAIDCVVGLSARIDQSVGSPEGDVR